MSESELLAGDVLLYRPEGIFGRIIAIKTWHDIAHCEGYIGSGMSVASRDGQGVGHYPVRSRGLTAIMRPHESGDLSAAMRWFATVQGQPYGWLDLAAFVGLGWNGPGMICSSFLTRFERAKGIEIFNGERAEKIAPFQFRLEPHYACVWEATS